MNIDPKSETKELRKKLESEFNTYRNSVFTTESSAPVLNDFNWFFDKYTALQSENQRLTEESASRKESIRIQMQQIERLTKINEELVKAAKDIAAKAYDFGKHAEHHLSFGKCSNPDIYSKEAMMEELFNNQPLNHEQS